MENSLLALQPVLVCLTKIASQESKRTFENRSEKSCLENYTLESENKRTYAYLNESMRKK